MVFVSQVFTSSIYRHITMRGNMDAVGFIRFFR